MKEDQKRVYDLFTQVTSLRAHSFELQSNNGLIINFSQNVKSKAKTQEDIPWYFWFYTAIWKLELNNQILVTNSDSSEKIHSEMEKLKNKKLLEVNVPGDKYDVKMKFEGGFVFHMMAEDYSNCRIPVKIQKIATNA